jgi:hypothetical protein
MRQAETEGMSESTDSKPKPRKPIRWLWPAAAVEALIVVIGLMLIVQCHSGDAPASRPNSTQPGALPKSN